MTCARQWVHLLKKLTLPIWRNKSFILSSHLHQRLRSHGRKSKSLILFIVEEQSYKPHLKRKTVGQIDEREFLTTWPAWEAILPIASALGWQALPGPQKVAEPCNFLRVLAIFSSKLNRTWLWAQAVVHNPLNCLSINIVPGTVSAHAR